MRTIRIILIQLFCIAVIAGCTGKSPEYSSVIEIILNNEADSTQLNQLSEIVKSQHISDKLYQWKNRIIIYDKIENPEIVEQKIKESIPEVIIRIYKEPFYIFDRQLCDKKALPEPWQHIIMTANLVEDKKMQQEYVDYHATQFEKWPEISKGFCNADFQQLLVFRNGQQLMLIISIPEGKTLDELNPKTTENNPRVDEWNSIMSKYQEGIEGTKPGETWVLFNRIKD